MPLRATVVSDIRFACGIAGAVEFHAGKLTIFWTCPCGCGEIGSLGFLKSFASRSPVSIYAMEFDNNGKPCAGKPMTIGFVYDDGTVHWAGTLVGGVWKKEEGDDPSGSLHGLRDDQRTEGPSS